MYKISKTDNNKKINSYKKRLKSEENVKNYNNKNNQFILPISLKKNRDVKNESLKNDSLATLRKFIKSPKPYLVTSSIRKKIKVNKEAQNDALDNFYCSSIKTYSARHHKNKGLINYLKDNKNSYSTISKNKILKLIDIDDNIKNRTNYKTKFNNINNIDIDKVYKTLNINNNSKENFSKKTHSIFSNSRIDYSSMPTAALTTRNFYKKPKYFINNNNLYGDYLGLNNSNLKEPTYAKKGILKSFMNEIDNIRKDNYKNYYLKLYEFKKNILNENIECQIQLDERTKTIANYYLNKYNDSYNIYWYKLKKNINKEYDINDNLKYEIKNLKLDINKLTIKIQKLLIKLSIFDEIREFLFELKKFSLYPYGTPYKQLMEVKNILMEKIKNNEKQTNLNIYLLNKKDIGLDLFINKYKSISDNDNRQKNILNAINDFADVPDKIDSNIKNLLWNQNILEREIDSLNLTLYDILEDLKNEKIYEKKILTQYNNLIKIVSNLKTENDNLNYKVEMMKEKIKNDKYGKLNKNIIVKILTIFNYFNKNGYITKKDNLILNKLFPNDMIKYLMICLTIIEKNIIILLKFKKEVINNDPILKKSFELNSKVEATKRKQIKEKNERYIKIKNTIIKLNKVKYYNEQKDFYYLNRREHINKCKRISKEKQKEINNKKTPIEIILDSI